MDPSSFYDDIAELYDLVYADWEGSMRRHGAAISAMLGRTSGAGARILDVSAGIGTQALPLAALGYVVVARDLSAGAIRRLGREAESRGLSIDAATGDMRLVGGSVSGRFDAVISFDNSLPHLLSDAEIADTLRGFAALLREGGSVLVSVRDYSRVDRSPTSFHPYGERVLGGRTFRLGQAWKWVDATHYDTTMIIESNEDGVWKEVVRTEARYYAIPVERLLALMEGAGLEAERVVDVPFFQPVLRGRARNWRARG